MSANGHKKRLGLPYARPAAKRPSSAKPKKPTYTHDPPLVVGPDAIFFKSDSGRGGWAFLSNYWPFVKPAAVRGCARDHDIHPPAGEALFTVDGVGYKSVEHFYHSERQPKGAKAIRERIRNAEDGLTAKKINNEYKKLNPSPLSAAEERQLVKQGLLAKFGQNEDLRRGLLSTASRTLHEGAGMGASTNRWTLTQDGAKGGDLLGQLLMEVREELAASAPSPSSNAS
ncbi:hypothetical protein HDU89_004911 [Geranomyces variabilis]|nr:hypothetical protein HDU89_004911 [Geranomyces variabilis]